MRNANSVRPLRSVASGDATEEDRAQLTAQDAEMAALAWQPRTETIRN